MNTSDLSQIYIHTHAPAHPPPFHPIPPNPHDPKPTTIVQNTLQDADSRADPSDITLPKRQPSPLSSPSQRGSRTPQKTAAIDSPRTKYPCASNPTTCLPQES
ncbi:hypothetical protein J1614_010364 [Plenodomus biglobosus]|nr:hypothetical protein J1614_010364 [Plenodomus biglobosus]